MKYDFDVVLEELTKLDGRTFHNTTESSQAYSCFLMDNMDAIQFALKFTKAALSGEVSAGCTEAGARSQLTKDAQHETLNDGRKVSDIVWPVHATDVTNAFKAMCQQLAKEIG